MKSITYYMVYFDQRCFLDGYMEKGSAFLPSSWTVERLNEGFWLNEDFKITDGHDNVYWVAPARIIGVEKKTAKGKNAKSIAKELGIWIKK